MRFHALLPVRDEADIVGQCLRQLLAWADAVYVFDTGSADDTWDIVRDLASTENRVRLLGQDPVYFSETRLRGWMFHQARAHMREGDWLLRVDADEFHHVPPPEFVRTRLARHETIVFHQYYDFRLTEAEVRAWQEGQETLSDRARPIEQRRRCFTASPYTEPRLCRYRATMRWPPTVSFPFNAGFRARACRFATTRTAIRCSWSGAVACARRCWPTRRTDATGHTRMRTTGRTVTGGSSS
jgi:glycosyltransferase involved in cell wall biosynthesis